MYNTTEEISKDKVLEQNQTWSRERTTNRAGKGGDRVVEMVEVGKGQIRGGLTRNGEDTGFMSSVLEKPREGAFGQEVTRSDFYFKMITPAIVLRCRMVCGRDG